MGTILMGILGLIIMVVLLLLFWSIMFMAFGDVDPKDIL